MENPIRVIPAILTDSPEALETMVSLAETFTDRVQLDIMDGRFVPSCSITAENVAGINTRLHWEAHLMTEHPASYLEGFKQAGAERVIFHYEAADPPREVISQAKVMGLDIGIAVNPDTPATSISLLVDDIDCILFMSVHPGFYGSRFIPGVLDKIIGFRQAYPDMEIGIDGGIKESNIASVARSGANSICVGSAIFCQKNPIESYKRLTALANEAL